MKPRLLSISDILFLGFMFILAGIMCIILYGEVRNIRKGLTPKAKYVIYTDEKPMDLGDGRFVIRPIK
jgi:hypothetical protein